MVSIDSARQLALALPETTEQPHFHLSSFRVKQKIFSTLWEAEKKMMVKLSLVDQSVFCDIDRNIIYPVPGGWGRQGATFIELSKVKKQIAEEALACAWKNTAPAAMVKKYMPEIK
ncbi:MAG: MmcQ/YjbR family DNA-binding protein [Ferruginibacter sp.]